jgi:nitrous oxide reductase family maturation protein NosD
MRRLIALVALVLVGIGPAMAQTQHSIDELAALIDAAKPGDTIMVPEGVYVGNLVVTKSVTLDGGGRAILDAGGDGDAVQIKAEDVTVRRFTVRRTGDSLDRENAGFTILAARALIEYNTIEDALFGVYLKAAPDSVIRFNTIRGKDLPLGRRGDAIRLWRCPKSTIEDNTIINGRDVVIWFSGDTQIRRNKVSHGRYGLHFMYSDNNVLEDNVLTHNSVGIFLMYSKNLTLIRNRLEHNRGPTGYGIGLKDVDGVIARDNVIAGNRLGIFLDNSPASRAYEHEFSGNSIAYNDVGVAFMPSVKHNTFVNNAFIDNIEQVAIMGSGTLAGNPFSVDGRGNYWSDYRGYDQDDDGIGDLAHRCESLFEDLMDREPKLRLFIYSPAQQAIDAASRAFPIVRPRVKVTDGFPLMTPPRSSVAVPQTKSAGMIWLSAALLSIGALTLTGGRRIGLRSDKVLEGASL